jgi:hypothetical protein
VALVEKHCIDCHGGTNPDAGLDLARLAFDPSDPRGFSSWVRVHDRLEAGEMPPPDANQPSPDERRAAVSTLHKTLHAASLARQKTEGRVALRRINRTQHENTLNDLLGVSIHLGDVLPDDGSVGGFDNVSEGLDVSSTHLVRYQQAADLALDAAIATRPPKKLVYRRTGKETPEKHGGFLQLMDTCVRLEGERLNVYIGLPGHISIQSDEVPQTGRYRLKLVAQAINTGGRPLPLEVRVLKTIHRSEGRTLATFDAPPDHRGTGRNIAIGLDRPAADDFPTALLDPPPHLLEEKRGRDLGPAVMLRGGMREARSPAFPACGRARCET